MSLVAVAEPVSSGKELSVDFSSITRKPYTTLDLFLEPQCWSVGASSPGTVSAAFNTGSNLSRPCIPSVTDGDAAGQAGNGAGG